MCFDDSVQTVMTHYTGELHVKTNTRIEFSLLLIFRNIIDMLEVLNETVMMGFLNLIFQFVPVSGGCECFQNMNYAEGLCHPLT